MEIFKKLPFDIQTKIYDINLQHHINTTKNNHKKVMFELEGVVDDMGHYFGLYDHEHAFYENEIWNIGESIIFYLRDDKEIWCNY
tara:strand:+ start:940 stop:1194 length:255 start_codon:yes stop_codon:yes gene_type:complete